MSAEGEFFKLRITDAEREKLEKDAAAKGLTQSDFIREKLGFKKRRAPSLPASEGLKTITAAAAKKAATEEVDPEANPGLAGLEELAKRLYGSEGIPMREARKRAAKQLTDA